MISETVMKEVAPERLVGGDPAIGELFKVAMNNPEFTREDLKEIAEKAFGQETAKRLSRKVGTPPAKTPATRKEPEKSLSWDDV
jgi:hypothetical protein